MKIVPSSVTVMLTLFVTLTLDVRDSAQTPHPSDRDLDGEERPVRLVRYPLNVAK